MKFCHVQAGNHHDSVELHRIIQSPVGLKSKAAARLNRFACGAYQMPIVEAARCKPIGSTQRLARSTECHEREAWQNKEAKPTRCLFLVITSHFRFYFLDL